MGMKCANRLILETKVNHGSNVHITINTLNNIQQLSHNYKNLLIRIKKLRPFYIMETLQRLQLYWWWLFCEKLGLTKDVPYQSWAFGTGMVDFIVILRVLQVVN